ncbi:MAG TPA: hypothetical protein VGT04_06745 [Acidobacteriaceae bacterium]|nr:hypothetical protein [Acidobacteriaceae bacterium]
MNLIWALVWFIMGFGIAVPMTYLWTVHHRKLNAFEERLRAEKAEAFQAGKDSAPQNITFERMSSTSRRGLIWKSTYKVISERALLNGIPITPFYEYAMHIDEGLDPHELGHVADAIRTSVGLPSLTDLGLRSLPEKAANKVI